MTEPHVLKRIGYGLLIVAIGLLIAGLLSDDVSAWLLLAACVPAFAGTTLLAKAEPERYRKKKA